MKAAYIAIIFTTVLLSFYGCEKKENNNTIPSSNAIESEKDENSSNEQQTSVEIPSGTKESVKKRNYSNELLASLGLPPNTVLLIGISGLNERQADKRWALLQDGSVLYSSNAKMKGKDFNKPSPFFLPFDNEPMTRLTQTDIATVLNEMEARGFYTLNDKEIQARQKIKDGERTYICVVQNSDTTLKIFAPGSPVVERYKAPLFSIIRKRLKEDREKPSGRNVSENKPNEYVMLAFDTRESDESGDWSHYLNSTWETAKNLGVHPIYVDSNFNKVDIKRKNGEILKTMDISQYVNDMKVGLLCIKTGEKVEPIGFDPSMEERVKQFFTKDVLTYNALEQCKDKSIEELDSSHSSGFLPRFHKLFKNAADFETVTGHLAATAATFTPTVEESILTMFGEFRNERFPVYTKIWIDLDKDVIYFCYYDYSDSTFIYGTEDDIYCNSEYWDTVKEHRK